MLKDMVFSKWIEARPHLGILASLSGFGVSLLGMIHVLSVIFGLGGAIFGFVAGYYTWRIKREHWRRIRHATASADKTYRAAVAAASKAYHDTMNSAKLISQ